MEDDPESRRRAMVSAVVAARRDDEPVTFEARTEAGAGPEADPRVVYEDRSLRLAVDDAGRDRLEDLLSEYHVFKVAQPETRKADPGVVYLSAVTDPKHAADFLEALFREVYDAPPDYELAVEE